MADDRNRMVGAPTAQVTIWVAGDEADAKRVCRKFCLDVGLCVTVTPTEYIYTGGSERGVMVGLVNYPRFPRTFDQIWATALQLARTLRDELFQHSVLLTAHDRTTWITNRPEKLPEESRAEVIAFEERLRKKGLIKQATITSLLERVREFVMEYGKGRALPEPGENWEVTVPIENIERLAMALEEHERVSTEQAREVQG